MSLIRFFKTIFMIDFLTGLIMAIKEIFKPKKQLIIHLNKVQLVLEQEENMH